MLLRLLFLAALALAMGLHAHAGEPPIDPNDRVVGVLEDGKTYRRVNGQPIDGSEVGDVLLEDGDQWPRAVEDFTRRELVRAEMERTGIAVNEQEVSDGVLRIARIYAVQVGVDPAKLTGQNLAGTLGVDLDFLREEVRTTLGLKKVLVDQKKLAPEVPLEDPGAKSVMEEYLKLLVAKYEVVVDAKQLHPGEAVRIEQRGYSRPEVRRFALNQRGPLKASELRQALDIVMLQRLAREALKAQGKEELNDDDRRFHFWYRVRQIEYEQGVPDGRRILEHDIHNSGMSTQQFLKDRRVYFDAVVTYLAKKAIGYTDLEAEWKAHPEKYRRKETNLAHIFLRVYDPQGRAYSPDWLTPGHTRVNEHVKRVREERFEESRARMESLVGLAHADFLKAAQEHSDDEHTRKVFGKLGRVSATAIPAPPLDKESVEAALKLKPGEVSAPVRSAYGWHLFKCLEEQETSFDEELVKEHIYVELLKTKRQEISEALRKQATIEDLF